MVNILIVGAGKSSTYLIDCLLKASYKKQNKWNVVIADSDERALTLRVQDYLHTEIAVLDIMQESRRQSLVRKADIVVSLMPPHLHILLAKDCLQFGKHLITSSYVSPEMKELNIHVRDAGLMFMCEMGLDPGIDHMTASRIFDSIHKVSSRVMSFESYCGGLVAPESDTNPWHYKFSWNPRNIINAGKDGAHYLQGRKEINVPYEFMFRNNRKVYCPGAGNLAYYPNRDSLGYIDLYDLEDVKTFMRATLRHPDFCKGWDALITMGLTNSDDHYATEQLTYAGWIKALSGYTDTSKDLETYVWQKYGIEDKKVRDMVSWLGIFQEIAIKPGAGRSSGDILLELLLRKWAMHPDDKDMVVMQHHVKYEFRDELTTLISTMVVKGENSTYSAMAKTVGLPMAILTEMLATKKLIPPRGVLIPTMSDIYRPVLNKLSKMGIEFTETVAATV